MQRPCAVNSSEGCVHCGDYQWPHLQFGCVAQSELHWAGRSACISYSVPESHTEFVAAGCVCIMSQGPA